LNPGTTYYPGIDRAIVGKQKAFVLQGYGIDDNDAVRFVPHGNNNNDDCTTRYVKSVLLYMLVVLVVYLPVSIII
jgi:hypothetical protein